MRRKIKNIATKEDYDKALKELGGDRVSIAYIGNNKCLYSGPNFFGIIPAEALWEGLKKQ